MENCIIFFFFSVVHIVSNILRSNLMYEDETLIIVACYMFVSLTKSCWSSWICFLQVVKDASKVRKDASLNNFEGSKIPDENLYGYHRKCYQEYTHKQKLQRMVENKQVAVEQRKSGRESRTGGTCNKFLNAHSLLREICVGE